MCKNSYGTEKELIRAVEAAPEPLCIDPTFNLGAFSVTPITYHNLLVKTTRNGNHPILLGPVLIHQTKTLRPFHYFASTLVHLNPKLSGLQSLNWFL